MNKAIIIKNISNQYEVLFEDGSIQTCVAMGKVRLDKKPLVGDHVLVEEFDSKYGIQKILERKNSLIRPAIANVDQALIVMSAFEPDFSTTLVDRLIFLISYANIKPVLCVTKMDLVKPNDPIYKSIEDYRKSGYEVYTTGKDFDESEIIECFADKITVLTGQSGAGKSSLLNALLEEDKAIVTDVKGTTRDIVEGSILVGGVKLNLIDTAGVRESNDVVEKIGIEKSLNLIEEAQLILLVLDASEELSEEDKFILEKTKDKKRIVILNKTDLSKVNDYHDEVISISAKNNIGIEKIKEKIKQLFNVSDILNTNSTYFTNARQISLLKLAIEALYSVESAIKEGLEVDMIEIDLKLAWEKLGDIIGANYTEELVDNLFSRFCLGK